MCKYDIEYIDGYEFKKLERSLKKYNLLAYRRLVFDYYPLIRKGVFPGKIVSINNKVKYYELELPTSKKFYKVHGNFLIKYNVNEDTKVAMMETIEPHDLLSEGHSEYLTIYKGVTISKSNATKDMFKINLLNSLARDSYYTYSNTPDYNYEDENEELNKKEKILREINGKKDEIECIEEKELGLEEDNSCETDDGELEKLKNLIIKKINDIQEEKKEKEEDSELEYLNKKEVELFKNLKDIENNNNLYEIKLNFGLIRNRDFEINKIIRNSSIKKIFNECEEINPFLAKYHINKGKVEFTNMYLAFVLNDISDGFKKAEYNPYHDIQQIINHPRFLCQYSNVDINFEDFYKKHEEATYNNDKNFLYDIKNVTVDGYLLKYVFDILGHSIKINIEISYNKRVLFTNSDKEQAILMVITNKNKYE